MDYTAGYPDKFRFLDDEHEAIGKILGELRESTGKSDGQGPRMLALNIQRQLKRHMAAEEDIMKSCDYPDFEQHGFDHESLLDMLEIIVGLFDHQAMVQNQDGVANHIEGKLHDEILADRLFAQFLRERSKPA